MEQANNSIEEIQFRKYSKRLVISGLAMIMLSVWSFFRFGLEVYSERKLLVRIMTRAVEQTPDMTLDDGLFLLKVILVFLLIALFFSVLFHLFIGIMPLRDGLGKKSLAIYLLLVVMVAQSAFYSIGDFNGPVSTLSRLTEGAGEEETEELSEDLEDPEDLLDIEESEDMPDIEDAEDPEDMFEETEDTMVNDGDTEFTSNILDVTTIIICFEMLYCSIRKRILKAKLKG
jgi:hypothetical protein